MGQFFDWPRHRMKEFDEVSDSDGNRWECSWRRLEGYPIPSKTRVRLRPIGTDTYTHYVDAPYPADIFKADLIDGKFTPTPVR